MPKSGEQPTADQQLDRQENKDLVSRLTNSRIYQDYEHAFSGATGLPISFRPVESWQLPNHGHPNENPLCALLADKSKSCSACLQIQEKLSENARFDPATLTCPLGLSDTAVPVRLGDQLIGFLQTGQVFRKKLNKKRSHSRTRKLHLKIPICGQPGDRRPRYKVGDSPSMRLNTRLNWVKDWKPTS